MNDDNDGADDEIRHVGGARALYGKGFDILYKMGFRAGQGIGSAAQGIRNPLLPIQRPGRKGLTAASALPAVVAPALQGVSPDLVVNEHHSDMVGSEENNNPAPLAPPPSRPQEAVSEAAAAVAPRSEGLISQARAFFHKKLLVAREVFASRFQPATNAHMHLNTYAIHLTAPELVSLGHTMVGEMLIEQHLLWFDSEVHPACNVDEHMVSMCSNEIRAAGKRRLIAQFDIAINTLASLTDFILSYFGPSSPQLDPMTSNSLFAILRQVFLEIQFEVAEDELHAMQFADLACALAALCARETITSWVIFLVPVENLDDWRVKSRRVLDWHIELYSDWRSFFLPHASYEAHHFWAQIVSVISNKVHRFLHDWQPSIPPSCNLPDVFSRDLFLSWKEWLHIDDDVHSIFIPKLRDSVSYYLRKSDDLLRSSCCVVQWASAHWRETLGSHCVDLFLEIMKSLQTLLETTDSIEPDAFYPLLQELNRFDNMQHVFTKHVFIPFVRKLARQGSQMQPGLPSSTIAALLWTPLLGKATLANILKESGFFDSWLECLKMWTQSAVNQPAMLEEISAWYRMWRRIFWSAGLLETEQVVLLLIQALHLMFAVSLTES